MLKMWKSDMRIDYGLEAAKIHHMKIGTENKFRKIHFGVVIHKYCLDKIGFPGSCLFFSNVSIKVLFQNGNTNEMKNLLLLHKSDL